jgi:two-component system NarL family sensor kinase
MNSWLKYVPLPAALLLLLLFGCDEKPAREVTYKLVSQPLTDSTCEWLEEKANFHTDRYYPVFRAYYSRKLKQKEYASAASALDAVAKQEMYYLFFSEEILKTVRDFRLLYSSGLPWQKTIFIHSYLGNYYINRGEFRKALPHFRKITEHEPFDYYTCSEIGYAYGDIAFCYTSIGEHKRALQSDQKALSLFGKTDNLSGTGGIYDNIAVIHMYTQNYREAGPYFDKAMEVYKQEGDTTNMFNTLYNKILLYQETKDIRQYTLIDSAYRFFEASNLEDPSLEIAIASMYVEKLLYEGRIPEAKIILDDMKNECKKLESESLSVDADYQIALAKYEIKAVNGLRNAEVIETALHAVRQNDDYLNQIAFSDILKQNALLKGDYKTALRYSEEEKEALNKLTNKEIRAKTMELNKQHQTEKKVRHIHRQQQTIANSRSTIAFLIALLTGLLLVVIIVFSRQRQKKVRAENRRVKQYTRQLLEKTEEERKRIASDLHDSVSHELLNLKHSIVDTSSAAGDKIDTIIKDIRSISRNLHPVMFEKVGLAASVDQLVERAQSVNDLMVTADIAYHSSLSVSDELQVYRIIQEALSNIIKYAEAVAARIIIREEGNELHIRIQDNGKGFNVTETLAKADAFGLHNIIERSKAIGGFARIASDKNGTIITIALKRIE